MVRRVLLTAIVGSVLLLLPGCVLVESGREATRRSWQLFKPRPTDYRDATDVEKDDWEFVGKEGRGNRPLDDEHDPFKKYLMSPKARNIERNLGIN